jgi:hypothetical protein
LRAFNRGQHATTSTSWSAIYENDERTDLEHAIIDLLIQFPKDKVAQLLRDEVRDVEAGHYDVDVEATKAARK